MPSAQTHAFPSPHRGVAWTAAVILIAGSLLFLAGGRSHPSIGAASGPAPEDFFRAFAETVQHTHGWHAMHLLILVGPLVWAVAAPAILDVLRPEARVVTSMARSALLLAGALWAVAFVLDGFGAPVFASTIVSASAPEVAGAALTSFQALAIMMSRLGLVSWIAGGLGMAVLAGSLLAPGKRTAWRTAVGTFGLLIGAWPLLAALQGEYAGGPFTSRFWMPNALLAALWYVALATCAFGRRPRLAA